MMKNQTALLFTHPLKPETIEKRRGEKERFREGKEKKNTHTETKAQRARRKNRLVHC